MTMQTTSTEELKTIIDQAWMDILNPDTTPMTRAIIGDLLEEAEAELTRREEQQDTYTKLVSSPEVKAVFMEQLEAMIQAGIEHNKKNGKIA